MSALIWVVMMLLCAIALAQDCGSGFQVNSCSGDQNIIGELEYVITSNELAIQNWKLCPRSDSSIPQWKVSFELDSAIVFGIFCNDMAFNSPIVCVTNGTLVIKREQFENQNGTYNFKFVSSELESSLQIIYAPTGVYPLNSTVRVNEGVAHAKLSWLIFDSNIPIAIKLFRGVTLLTVNEVDLVEGNECISTVTGESTTVWNVFIDKPNSSTEGDYILVVINSEGQSSATVQLIVDSISPSTIIKMIPSTSLIVSTSESFTDSHTSTTSTTSTASTTSTPSSSVKTIISITLSVAAVVIVGCGVIVVLIILLCIFSLKRRREEVASNESPKPESVEIPDNVNSNLTPNNVRPQTVGGSTSANDTTVTLKGTSVDNYPGITINHHEYHNNEGGEHTDSPNVTSTPQLDTHPSHIPPDNPLSSNSEVHEDIDLRNVTTTPRLSTRPSLVPPDNPLSSHSGTSLTDHLLQENLKEHKITNMYLKDIYGKQSQGVELNKGILQATEMATETQQDMRAIQRETHSLIEARHVTEQENTLDNVIHTVPDISELNELVGSQITSQWELFGAQVRLNPNDLEMLRSEDAQVRFYHLFVQWKRTQCSDFSWDAVIKVLQSQTINQPTLANKVLRHLENSTMKTDSCP